MQAISAGTSGVPSGPCRKTRLALVSAGAHATPMGVLGRITSNNEEVRNMALGIYFALSGMSVDKYNESIKRLKQAGAAHPAGRSYPASFGTSDKLMVFDVWTPQAAFNKFGKTLMPILQQLGVEPGQPSVMEIHKVITPPAARPKKRAPIRRSMPLCVKKRGRSAVRFHRQRLQPFAGSTVAFDRASLSRALAS